MTIQNPLYAVVVGSAYGVRGFQVPPFSEGMTKFIGNTEYSISMTGNSSYSHTDNMNQASVGMSGSCGASGVGEFKAAVSAYCGRAEATNNKTLEVSWHCMKYAGVEYMDLENITIGNPYQLPRSSC